MPLLNVGQNGLKTLNTNVGSFQMVPKWYPNGFQMVPKWFPNCTQMFSKYGTQMDSKYGTQMVSKWYPNGSPNGSPNGFQMVS